MLYGQSRYHKMVRIHKVLLKSLGNDIANYLAGSFSKHAERYTPEDCPSLSRGFFLTVIPHRNYLWWCYIDSSLTAVFVSL